MKWTLWLAGLHDIGWGVFIVLFPSRPFEWVGVAAPAYPEIGQLAGALAGCYGLGYLIAAIDPFHHWAIVAVGLTAKMVTPLGFLMAATEGRLPWEAGWAVVASSVVWWIPFGLILNGALKDHAGFKRMASPEVQRMALQKRTQYGHTVFDLSSHRPLLLVFLRHYGCPFCREALADLAERRRAIEALGTRIVLMHMGTEDQAASFFERYKLEDLPRVSDPDRYVYRAFGLGRGDFLKLVGPKVILRSFQALLVGGHRIGRMTGDGFQMPGVFLLFHGEVLRSYRHLTSADRPDYMNLADAEQFPA
jgi:peroxiredoxin